MKVLFIALIILIPLTVFYFIPAFTGDIAVASSFNLGSVPVHYYGLLLALGILASYFVATRLARYFGIWPAQIENALPWLIIFGFLGARLYFVIFSWDYFREHPAEIVQIWKGGLSIYGGIIGAALGLFLYTVKNKFPTGKFFDIIAVVLPLGQAIGRFGNFFNEEAFGRPTNLPWKLYVSPASRPPHMLTEKFFHPTFLYEAVWNFLVFLVLWRIAKSQKNPDQPQPQGRQPLAERWPAGSLFGIYLILYSIGRFFIESLRLDSFFWNSLRIDQISALGMILVGLLIIILTRAKLTIE